MLIILEGPDGGGKSTLAHQLCARYTLAYTHEGPPPPDVDALERYTWKIQRFPTNTVHDRFALGERIYGPCYRGVDGLGDDGWKVIQHQLKVLKAVQIICYPPYENCYQAWSSGRAEMFPNVERFTELYHAYAKWTQDNTQYVYDYTRAGAFTQLTDYLDGLKR